MFKKIVIPDGARRCYERDFMDRVLPEPNSGCWLWCEGPHGGGYGTFRGMGVHRLSYVLFRGHIPEGMVVDHLCQNPACVNPRHLDAVTGKVNVHRGSAYKFNRNKTHCPRGHPYDSDNTIHRYGKRKCRECSRVWGRAAYQKKITQLVQVG